MTSKESRERERERNKERERERERERGVVFLRRRGLWSKYKHDAYSRSNGQSF